MHTDPSGMHPPRSVLLPYFEPQRVPRRVRLWWQICLGGSFVSALWLVWASVGLTKTVEPPEETSSVLLGGFFQFFGAIIGFGIAIPMFLLTAVIAIVERRTDWSTPQARRLGTLGLIHSLLWLPPFWVFRQVESAPGSIGYLLLVGLMAMSVYIRAEFPKMRYPVVFYSPVPPESASRR